MKRITIVLLAALLTVPAFAAGPHPASEVLPFSAPSKAERAESVAATAKLHNWVASFAADVDDAFEVQIPSKQLQALNAAEQDGGPLWVGVPGDVGFTYKSGSEDLGSAKFSDGNLVWSGVFRSPGATGVRLQLTDLDLPKGAELYVIGRHGHAFGPYAEKSGEFWTNTVAGDEIVLQLHLPLDVPQGKSIFRVESLTHMGDNYDLGYNPQKAFCPWNDSCIQNAECSSIPGSVSQIQDGVGYMIFSAPGGSFICSGGLLNDTGSTGTPFFLTANHCLSTQSSATSLEAYFQWTVGCGSSCGSQYSPPGSVPRTLGSTLLATSSNTDFTLLQLSQAAPAGSTFLGWTTAPVANSSGTSLYRVSHPKGSPQAYSEQDVNTSAGTCSTLPRGNFIYSDATFGDTEGGSSGSPVVNGSGQVVGQLFGACGASPSTTCDGDDRTVDGAFAVTYSSISSFLDPGTCSLIGASCNSNSDCCSNKCRGRRGNKTCR